MQNSRIIDCFLVFVTIACSEIVGIMLSSSTSSSSTPIELIKWVYVSFAPNTFLYFDCFVCKLFLFLLKCRKITESGKTSVRSHSVLKNNDIFSCSIDFHHCFSLCLFVAWKCMRNGWMRFLHCKKCFTVAFLLICLRCWFFLQNARVNVCVRSFVDKKTKM